MNISIVIGWIIGFGMVIFGILQGGEFIWFFDPPSLAITVGGTIGCLIASYPMSYLAGVPKKIKMVFTPKKYKPEKYIDEIVEYAKIARGRGLLALEESANNCKDQFMKSALMLIVDANDTAKVRGMLDDAISFMCERHESGRSFFEKGVAVFPAFGMLGTLVGLVNMLNTMDSDPDGLAGGMATALITTFYGSLFANVLFNPMANALKNSHEDELLCMQIIEEGVLAIADGSNPRYIQEKLEFMLPASKKRSGNSSAS